MSNDNEESRALRARPRRAGRAPAPHALRMVLADPGGRARRAGAACRLQRRAWPALLPDARVVRVLRARRVRRGHGLPGRAHRAAQLGLLPLGALGGDSAVRHRHAGGVHRRHHLRHRHHSAVRGDGQRRRAGNGHRVPHHQLAQARAVQLRPDAAAARRHRAATAQPGPVLEHLAHALHCRAGRARVARAQCRARHPPRRSRRRMGLPHRRADAGVLG